MDQHIAAVHEASHVVVACFVGFRSESVRVNDLGDGEFRINYENLNTAASMMMTMDLCPEFFLLLQQLDRNALAQLARRLCMILVSGGIAEAVLCEGTGSSDTAEVELAGPDLTRVEAISKHFRVDLKQTMEEVYMIIKHDRVWAGVIALKEAILNSPTMELDATEIEIVLKSSGYLSFLEE